MVAGNAQRLQTDATTMIDPSLQHSTTTSAAAQAPQSASSVGSFYLNPHHAMVVNGDGLTANGNIGMEQQQTRDVMAAPISAAEMGESVSMVFTR